MTFFDWPHIGPNIPGTDSIAGTSFRVKSQEALDFWFKRFQQNQVIHGEIQNFAGRLLLPFEDPEGQQLYLVNDKGYEFDGEIWERSDIPDEFALRGFYSSILSVPESSQLTTIFTEILNFAETERTIWIDEKSTAILFSTTTDGGPGTEIWLLEQPDQSRARLGAGGTHHVAFRVDDFDAQKAWHSHLIQQGIYVSQLIDRFWFRSIYFRVSNGILFEIATDGPGFAIDEDADHLGEKLVLPPFLESRRREIEAGLTPIEA